MPKSKEKCQEIRDEMRKTILHKSLLYFARNGFAGTKIGDLAKEIGIAQGTIYIYFESKEELFKEIMKMVDSKKLISQMKLLVKMPVTARKKLRIMSEYVLKSLNEEEEFAAMMTLSTQLLLEQDENNQYDEIFYKTELYNLTGKIIRQGQKEGDFAKGTVSKLTDYYWGVVYLYSLKSLFTTKYECISVEDLERTVLKA